MVKKVIIFLMMGTLLVYIFDNMVFAPSRIESDIRSLEYPREVLRAHLEKKKNKILEVAHDEVGLEESILLTVSLEDLNIVRKKFGVLLQVWHPNYDITQDDILRSPQFKQLFEQIPAIVTEDLKPYQKSDFILEYYFLLRSGKYIYFQTPMPYSGSAL